MTKVQVVGKSIPVEILEPLCEVGHEDQSPYNMDWLRLYYEAHTRFQERRFDVAARLFEACLNDYPENKTCLMLLQMCREFSENPPPEDWNGAMEFTSK